MDERNKKKQRKENIFGERLCYSVAFRFEIEYKKIEKMKWRRRRRTKKKQNSSWNDAQEDRQGVECI